MAMFARVTRSEGRPEDADAFVKYVRETILPAMNKINGFKGAYVLLDRSTGRSLGMTLWESEAARKASEDAVAQLRNRCRPLGQP